MYPILFRLGSIVFPSYVTMLCMSFIIGILLWYKLASDEGIADKHIFSLMLIVNLLAIIGARLLFFINNFRELEDNPIIILSLSPEGFDYYGGFIFAVIGSVLYIVINNLLIWKISDLIAPLLSLGLSITRIGCFLSGCCYGIETSLPWGVQFPVGSPASLKYGIIHHIHPSQLYESLFCLIIFIVLLKVRKSKKFDGQVSLAFVIFYAIMRSLNEFTRGDVPHNYLFELTQVQLINLVLLSFSLFLYFYLKNKKLENTTNSDLGDTE